MAVDADVAREASGDPRDGPFLLDVVNQLLGLSRRTRAVDADVEIEGLPVEGGCRNQVGEAGPKDCGGTQCGHGQDRTHEGGANRDSGTAATALDGAANADQCARGCAQFGQKAEGPRRKLRAVSAAGPGHPRDRDSGPDAQSQEDGQEHQASDQERPSIEGEPVRRFGKSRLTYRREARQPVGQQYTAGDADDADRCSPGHSHQEELPPRDP